MKVKSIWAGVVTDTNGETFTFSEYVANCLDKGGTLYNI